MHNLKTLFYSLIVMAAVPQLPATAQEQTRLLVAPSALGTDGDGNVYVVDLKDGRGAIYKYDPNGARAAEVTKDFPNNGLGAVALDKRNGIIYFTTPNSPGVPWVWKSDPNGIWDSSPEPFGPMPSAPTGLAVDRDGNLYTSGGGYLMKYDTDGNFLAIVGYPAGSASKVLGVDSKNRVYYTNENGKKLLRATLSDGRYKSEPVPTSGSCDAMAIDDNDTLYIADKDKGTIRKHGPDDKESVLPGWYGDLRAIALHGKQLYIANGIDGVLKVDAPSGLCAGTRLFQIRKPYDYFVRNKSGTYYLSSHVIKQDRTEVASLDEYDSNGTFRSNIDTGGRAKGLAIDKDGNLIFTMQSPNSRNSRLIWRPKDKPQAEFRFGEGEGVAYTPNKQRAFFTWGRSLMSISLNDDGTFDLFEKTIADNIEGLRGLAASDNGDVYWVDIKEKTIGRAKLTKSGLRPIFDEYDVNRNFIRGVWEPEAVAVDKNGNIYATNSCESQDMRHIGRYSKDGKFLSDLFAQGMRNDFYNGRVYLRDLFVDSNGRDIIVLQRLYESGEACEVWKYSNIFAT